MSSLSISTIINEEMFEDFSFFGSCEEKAEFSSALCLLTTNSSRAGRVCGTFAYFCCCLGKVVAGSYENSVRNGFYTKK